MEKMVGWVGLDGWTIIFLDGVWMDYMMGEISMMMMMRMMRGDKVDKVGRRLGGN